MGSAGTKEERIKNIKKNWNCGETITVKRKSYKHENFQFSLSFLGEMSSIWQISVAAGKSTFLSSSSLSWQSLSSVELVELFRLDGFSKLLWLPLHRLAWLDNLNRLHRYKHFFGEKTNTFFRWKEGKGNVSLKTAVSEDISLSLLRLNEKGMITKHHLIMENWESQKY